MFSGFNCYPERTFQIWALETFFFKTVLTFITMSRSFLWGKTWNKKKTWHSRKNTGNWVLALLRAVWLLLDLGRGFLIWKSIALIISLEVDSVRRWKLTKGNTVQKCGLLLSSLLMSYFHLMLCWWRTSILTKNNRCSLCRSPSFHYYSCLDHGTADGTSITAPYFCFSDSTCREQEKQSKWQNKLKPCKEL